jgi:hypothetical protein
MISKFIMSIKQFEKFISKHDSVSKILTVEYGKKIKFISEIKFYDDEVTIYFMEV